MFPFAEKPCLIRLISIPLFNFIFCLSGSGGDFRHIQLDGKFDDWNGVPLAAADSPGDVSGAGADFLDCRLANDNETFYIKLTVNDEILMQNSSVFRSGNEILLDLDADNNVSTGLQSGGLGVDLQIVYGTCCVVLHTPIFETLNLNEISSTALPTHTSEDFEFRIPYVITPGFDGETPLRGLPSGSDSRNSPVETGYRMEADPCCMPLRLAVANRFNSLICNRQVRTWPYGYCPTMCARQRLRSIRSHSRGYYARCNPIL